MCYNLSLEIIKGGCFMALFGKKKKDEELNAESAENRQSNSVTDEMKVILEAREEEQQEREAKALERQQEQDAATKKQDEMNEQVKIASEKVLNGMAKPEGMTFFVVLDEIPLTAEPETAGNVIVRGDIRGTIKAGTDVYLYQGEGCKYSVRVEKIRNENRDFVDEATYERVELEITRGDIPLPTDPDQSVERPVERFAVITDAPGIENMADPACRGMGKAGNPRTIAMLCEYGRYGQIPEFFSTTMDCVMTSEFLTPVKITPAKNGKSNISFAGMTSRKDQNVSLLPVFTDLKLAKDAQKRAFSKQGLGQVFSMSFAQAAAIGRDANHQGFIVNPGGPVSITLPVKLINDMVNTRLFKARFGEGSADNASLALGGTGNRNLDEFIGKGGPQMSGLTKIVIRNPLNTPEFLALEKALKQYCGSHPSIARLMILISAPEADQKRQSYLALVDCSEEAFAAECKGLAAAAKPFMKSVRTIQFQLFSKLADKESFEKRSTWLYSKLPL